MERLILEYQVGDGYTYSATNTIGIVYHDKSSAIDDLHILLLETISKQQAFEQESERLYKKLKGANRNEAELVLLLAEIKNHEKTEQKTITFGGCELDYGNFVYHDGKELQVSLPKIYTLEEFFAPAERNLVNATSNKVKMK